MIFRLLKSDTIYLLTLRVKKKFLKQYWIKNCFPIHLRERNYDKSKRLEKEFILIISKNLILFNSMKRNEINSEKIYNYLFNTTVIFS